MQTHTLLSEVRNTQSQASCLKWNVLALKWFKKKKGRLVPHYHLLKGSGSVNKTEGIINAMQKDALANDNDNNTNIKSKLIIFSSVKIMYCKCLE